MKKLIALILLFSVNSHACDWDTDIAAGPNGTYIYTMDCHIQVGKLVQANSDLTKALQLKDLALTTADQRTALWEKTSESEQDRMLKLTSDEKRSDWTMFALGALTVLGAGYVTAKLVK